MDRLPGTEPLDPPPADPAAELVEALHRFLDAALAVRYRARDPVTLADPEAATRRRAILAQRVGAVDPPDPGLPERTLPPAVPGPWAGPGYRVWGVRWPVWEGVEGEGLWLDPERPPQAWVVALPDADEAPEDLAVPGAWPARLARAGCAVVVVDPVERARVRARRPHREYLWRMGFELGRPVLGLEVQTVRALASALALAGSGPLGVFGYGEGGLLALWAGALDDRFQAVGVSGHLRRRLEVWQEPLERDVWRLFDGGTDADLAALVAPRGLVVEAADEPEAVRCRRPADEDPEAVEDEVRAAEAAFRAAGVPERIAFVPRGAVPEGRPGSPAALRAFLRLLGVGEAPPPAAPEASGDLGAPWREAGARRRARRFRQLVDHLQRVLMAAERERDAFLASARGQDPARWAAAAEAHRARLHAEVLGRAPDPSGPARPRSRIWCEAPGWRGYQVVLDVWPGVPAYALLLVPRDLRPGERRPAVVCQHGLEGRAEDVVVGPEDGPYRRFAARLADEGFVVCAPQNPYVGGERFRLLQRKAHPLGWSLFSLIVAEHARILAWLRSLPWVDPARVGFYGLSYGGKTAMRVPAVLPDYALSICSADFNEWIRKCAAEDPRFSYLETEEYDMYEFDLAHAYGYAEMAALIAPRPFMVERGHDDPVGLDPWVAYEYAKVRRLYEDLGIADRTEIAFFAGGHWVDGRATFAFLRRHLGDPRAAQR